MRSIAQPAELSPNAACTAAPPVKRRSPRVSASRHGNVHTVGLLAWRHRASRTADALYRNSLALARSRPGLAFPASRPASISRKARTEIAVREVRAHASDDKAIFCCFDTATATSIAASLPVAFAFQVFHSRACWCGSTSLRCGSGGGRRHRARSRLVVFLVGDWWRAGRRPS